MPMDPKTLPFCSNGSRRSVASTYTRPSLTVSPAASLAIDGDQRAVVLERVPEDLVDGVVAQLR